MPIAYELAAVRDAATAKVLPQFRPDLQCTGANKHFFALEYLESQFMLAFLRELQKRDRCASIIWLHDGLWVKRELSNSLIYSAERIAAQEVFPLIHEWPSLLRIECLQSKHSALRRELPACSGIDLFPSPPYQLGPHFSKCHPRPRFGKKRVGQGQAATFHARMLKRRRR